MNKYIFEHKLFVGFVNKVSTHIVTVHVPSSKNINKFFDNGDEFHGGLVNSYVVIEGEKQGFLCKVLATEIPEKERMELSTEAIKKKDFHPLMKLEVQSIFDYQNIKFEQTIREHPDVGAKVYIARKEVVKQYLKDIELHNFQLKTNNFAKLLNIESGVVDFSLQNLLSQHAAIVGTTGSGKSWTTGKLVENLIDNGQKIILIDPTGEYQKIADNYSEDQILNANIGTSHYINYRELNLEDLFYLVKPSASSQFPKLKSAINSLKLLEKDEATLREKGFVEEIFDNVKVINKKRKYKSDYKEIEDKYASDLSFNDLEFNILALPKQIENECIFDSDKYNYELFGDVENNSLGFCTTLISRIHSLLGNDHFDNIFNFTNSNAKTNILSEFDNFSNSDKNLLYINLKDIPFSFNLREVIADTLAKRTLSIAKKGLMKEKPCLLIVDEAHQFINKSVSNDFDTFKLEAFDNIAKEGRKYGLFLCITTQLPRDIPTRTLSQMGTFIVHRIINQRDKEIVQNSLPTLNKDIVDSLSQLGQGEVLLSSINIKQPLQLKVLEPKNTPDSNTPLFK